MVIDFNRPNSAVNSSSNARSNSVQNTERPTAQQAPAEEVKTTGNSSVSGESVQLSPEKLSQQPPKPSVFSRQPKS